jgi:hypothetical protein
LKKARGKRQEARGKRQEARGKRQKFLRIQFFKKRTNHPSFLLKQGNNGCNIFFLAKAYSFT